MHDPDRPLDNHDAATAETLGGAVPPVVRDVEAAVHPVDGINPPQFPREDRPDVLGAGGWSDFPTEDSPPFINRMLTVAEWQTYVAGYQFGSIPPTRVVLHHTYRPDEPQWAGLTSMRGMQRYYAGLGWTSAPHIYAGPDGIWLATPMSRVGIHAGAGNGSVKQGWYSIGLEMVGFFDTKLPAGKVWANTLAVLVGLSKKLGISPERLLSFHRDYTDDKTCPGRAVTRPWVLGEWVRAAAPPRPVELPPTHRAKYWVPVFEAPPSATHHPRVAWSGQAVLAPGQEVPLQPTPIKGWYHWPPNGFVEIAAFEPLAPAPDGRLPVYTADSPLMDPTPWGTRDGYVRACTRRCRVAGSHYTDYDLGTIFGAYWDQAVAIGADPWPIAAQVMKETGSLTSALSQRRDREGRDLRNPAGIGVYEPKNKATPHHRPGTVWDADVGGYRPASQFGDWVAESIPAHIGRYVAYALRPEERTPAQQEIVERGQAIARRPLDARCHGSADTLLLLGSGPNKAEGCGWAGAGNAEGLGYGAGLAALATGLVAFAAQGDT